jgi:hypothetical protein
MASSEVLQQLHIVFNSSALRNRLEVSALAINTLAASGRLLRLLMPHTFAALASWLITIFC